jgi:general secretion pathway protein A
MAIEHKLLQVLLVGEHGLAEQLRRTDLQPWDRRIRLRAELGPLAEGEVAGYVAHRLAVAGSIDSLFDGEAMVRVSALSRGLPGTVNALCDRVLTIGARESAPVVDETLVDRAARELGLVSDIASGSPWRRRIALLAVMVALMLAGAATAWMYREPLTRALANWFAR